MGFGGGLLDALKGGPSESGEGVCLQCRTTWRIQLGPRRVERWYWWMEGSGVRWDVGDVICTQAGWCD